MLLLLRYFASSDLWTWAEALAAAAELVCYAAPPLLYGCSYGDENDDDDWAWWWLWCCCCCCWRWGKRVIKIAPLARTGNHYYCPSIHKTVCVIIFMDSSIHPPSIHPFSLLIILWSTPGAQHVHSHIHTQVNYICVIQKSVWPCNWHSHIWKTDEGVEDEPRIDIALLSYMLSIFHELRGSIIHACYQVVVVGRWKKNLRLTFHSPLFGDRLMWWYWQVSCPPLLLVYVFYYTSCSIPHLWKLPHHHLHFSYTTEKLHKVIQFPFKNN